MRTDLYYIDALPLETFRAKVLFSKFPGDFETNTADLSIFFVAPIQRTGVISSCAILCGLHHHYARV